MSETKPINLLAGVGFTSFDDLMFESIIPSICPEECEVEPDGVCPHGHPSIAVALGII